jgi:hypothetical protein
MIVLMIGLHLVDSRSLWARAPVPSIDVNTDALSKQPIHNKYIRI